MRDFFYWQRLQFRQEKVAYTYSIRRRSKVRISNHSKRYIAHTIFDISIFDMMGAAFPETFPFLSSYTLHIHFLFSFFLCMLASSTAFPFLFASKKKKHFILCYSYYFFDKLFIIINNSIFKSLKLNFFFKAWFEIHRYLFMKNLLI